MAILSLAYQHDSQYGGTRAGIPIYDGSAITFHDWGFRTQIKHQAAKAGEKNRVIASIIEGLRGEAADIAMDLGTEELLKEGGLTVLTEELRSHIFPKKEAEAKALYKHGHKKKGLLSRQSSEPIVNYISVIHDGGNGVHSLRSWIRRLNSVRQSGEICCLKDQTLARSNSCLF